MTAAKSTKILVVDDDPEIGPMLERTLGYDGYTVSSALSGAEALETFELERPALIIVDLMMPHMDGEAFIETLRRTYAAEMPRVLLLSASDAREAIAKRLTVDASIAKPFELEELRDVVEMLIGQRDT